MQFASVIPYNSQKPYDLDTYIIFSINLKKLRHKEGNLLA